MRTFKHKCVDQKPGDEIPANFPTNCGHNLVKVDDRTWNKNWAGRGRSFKVRTKIRAPSGYQVIDYCWVTRGETRTTRCEQEENAISYSPQGVSARVRTSDNNRSQIPMDAGAGLLRPQDRTLFGGSPPTSGSLGTASDPGVA